jgi:aldose 1-epimerase
MFVTATPFDGKHHAITFGSESLKVTCSDFGATMTSVIYDGTEVTLCFDTLPEFADSRYFGATVGRYGNRICKGRFGLGGTEYTLATNNGENHLHGGVQGFNKATWGYSVVNGAEEVGVEFTRESPAGEEGYPAH